MWITCNRCCLTKTATKDISCNSAIINIYFRIIFAAFWRNIFSLVTTAIDITLFTVFFSFTEIHSTAINIDSNSILWSTEIIITTKDVVNATTFHRHSNRAIDIGCNSRNCGCCSLPFTTTIDITCNSATIEVHMGVTIGCYARILWIWNICIDSAVVC